MEIKLTQGKVAIVDDGDFEVLSRFRWTARRDTHTWYAFRTVRRRRGVQERGAVDMSRQIMGLAVGDPRRVIHLDGNGLNNTRRNLLVCTAQASSWKSRRPLPASGFRGVCWNSGAGKFQANARIDGRKRFLGFFDDPAEAGAAYDRAILDRGRFAVTNTMLRSELDGSKDDEGRGVDAGSGLAEARRGRTGAASSTRSEG